MAYDERDRDIPKDEQFQEVSKVLATALLRYCREGPHPNSTPAPEDADSESPPTDSVESPHHVGDKQKTKTNHAPIEERIKAKAMDILRQCKLPLTDEEDLCQSIRLDLLKRDHLFDPKRGSRERFETIVINSWAAMFLRGRSRIKHAFHLDHVPLDVLIDNDVARGYGYSCDQTPVSLAELVPDPSVEVPLLIDRRDALEYGMRTLSEHDRQLICLIARHGKAAAARSRGISRRQVDNIIVKRIRHHFERAGF